MRTRCRPARRGEPVALVPQRARSPRRPAAARPRCTDSGTPAVHGPLQPVHRLVDRVLGHHPVGRVLAAGDDDQPGDRVRDRVLAGQLRGRRGLARQQRAQAGVDALDVGAGQRDLQHRVDVLEQVVDVAASSPPGAPCRAPSRCRWCRRSSAAPTGSRTARTSRCAGSGPSPSGSGPAARPGGCPCWPGRGTGRARPTRDWVSSVQTPVALTTCRARTRIVAAALQVLHDRPGDPLALLQELRSPGPGWRRARRTPRRCGRGTSCAGRRRPARRSTASRRSASPCCSDGHDPAAPCAG